jgi:hypothetical protein
VSAIFVAEVVSLIEYNEVSQYLLTSTQGVEELIAIDLCGSDN